MLQFLATVPMPLAAAIAFGVWLLAAAALGLVYDHEPAQRDDDDGLFL